jgi:cell division septation protein DedD
MAPGNIKNFELKVGKAGLIIIVIGMAVLLCTAFLFGVDVGKNVDTYPDKISAFPQKILALIWRPANIRIAQSAPDSKSGQNQPQNQNQENIDLTFYNALTSKKGALEEQPVTGKQPVLLPPQKGEETNTGNFNMEAQNTTTAPANEKVKEKGDINVKEIAPSVDSNKQKFIIQVASLKDKNKADKIINKIDSLGFTSQVVKIESKKKGVLFRVIVSGFENKVQAQEAEQKISQKTGTSCMIKHVDNEAKKN